MSGRNLTIRRFIIFLLLAKYYSVDHIKEEEMDSACGTDRGNVNEYRVFEENFKETDQLECPVF